jgi:hypothetical protein
MTKRYQRGSSKAVNRRRTDNKMTKRYQRVLSVLLRFTAFDDPVGIFWSVCCPSFFDLRLLMTPLVSFGHCGPKDTDGVIKSRKSKKDGQHNDQKIPKGSSKAVNRRRTDGFWWPRRYLLVIVLSVILRFTAFDDPVGIFWSLCCPSFFDLRLLMTPLESKAINRRRTDNTMTKRYQRDHQKP